MDTNYSSSRAAKLKTWKRNRDHTDGADAVRANAKTYVPMRSNIDEAEYQALMLGTQYFPFAARTLQSFEGLIFRKPPIFDGGARFPEAISCEGQTAEELARACVHEYMITNDGGLFIDAPNTPEGATLADLERLNSYAYQSLYPAEAIREIRYQVIGGKKRLVYVRLVEDADHGRELRLVEGIYQATVWVRVDGTWFSETITPQVAGKPLSDIPFIPLADADTGSTVDDLCDMNATHFSTNFSLVQAIAWVSIPFLHVSGVAEGAQEINVVPGRIIYTDASDSKIDFVEYHGLGVTHLREQLTTIEQQASLIGSRLLIQEKAVSEAEGTVARRQAGENSILGSKSRHVSSRYSTALRKQAEMMGIDPNTVAYTLSTDFVPSTVDPALLGKWIEQVQAGLLPLEAFFENIKKADQIDESWTYEAYAAALDMEKGSTGAGTFAPPAIPPQTDDAA